MERFNFLTQKSRQWGWMCVTFQHFVDFPYVAELLAVWRRNRQMCTQTEIAPDSRRWVVSAHTFVCACASPQIERGWMVLSCSQSWGAHVATNRQEGLSGSPGAARPLALLAKLTWPILWGHLAPWFFSLLLFSQSYLISQLEHRRTLPSLFEGWNSSGRKGRKYQ